MIRTAPAPLAWLMRRVGFAGWTSLWGVAYVLPEYLDDRGLARHELCHLAQMERDGKFMFMVKYLYWLIRHGYRGPHPYEEEARRAQRG